MRELFKSTFREIKSSFGRFFAIFAIIALGVGFFSGLKVTRNAMVKTVKSYLDNHAFYDFRLLSTLGFEDADVESLQGREDVEAAEASVSLDMIYRLEDGSQGVMKTFSLPEQLNTVKLVSGRLPERDDECLADSHMFGESAVGTVVYLSEDNEKDLRDSFAHEAYTIVGTVQSPLYIQYERGNTSLGTGRLAGFLYLLPGGFDTDYYTEIYVRFRQDNALYGDGYRDYIDGKEALWEEYAEEAADRRYRSLLEEAGEELADAREEFEDKKAEGEAELADAAAELADARQEIADGGEAIAEAREELADGRKELEEKERELADGRNELAEKEQELADGEAQLARGEQEWQKGREQCDSGWAGLNSQKDQLSAQKAELEKQQTELEAGADLLETQRTQLETGKALLEEGKAQLETEAANAQEAAANGLISADALAALMQQIDEKKTSLDGELAQITAGLAQLAAKEEELAAGRQALAAGLQTIAAYESQIGEGERQLREADAELKKAREELDASRQALEDGRLEIENAKEELKKGERAIRDARSDLAEAEETLAEKEQELADARASLADGEREYEDGLREFDEEIADAERKLADAEAEIEDIREPDTYVLGRDTNVGYVCFENDSGIVDGIANIFPVFFFLVAALVCVTTMNRMVEEQRTQIGVLKALGYGNGAIMSKYMIYSGLAALLGCVFGFLLGTWAFPEIIWFVYGIMYSADPLIYVFDWRLAAVSLVVSLLCSVGTTWLSCRLELFQAAAQLMRPKAPKAGKRVFLEKIPFLWKRLGFLRKVSVRNIFRYKKRLFMMVLGIGGCTALLVTGFGIKDSIADVGARQFGEIQVYDCGISLKEEADGEFESGLEGLMESGIDSWLCVMEKSVDIVTDRGVKSIYLVAGDGGGMGAYVDLHTKSGKPIDYPGAGEAVINDKLAGQYGIRAGDTVTLRDEDMRSLTVTVTAVMENYVNNYVYISEETWEQAFSEAPERKTVYVNLQENADAHGLAAELMKLDGVANVTINADTTERIGNMLGSLDIIVAVVILCAAGLAFIVLYNLTNINITERIREIATIKVLGFYKAETASYVFRENILLTFMGMVPGLALGRLLHAFVMKQIQIDMISFQIYVKPVSYLYSAVLTVGFAWLVNLVMRGKLEAVSMTESLKSVD